MSLKWELGYECHDRHAFGGVETRERGVSEYDEILGIDEDGYCIVIHRGR